jgi:hypothetical protein
MSKPDLQEFRPYVVGRLKKGAEMDDIVLQLCEKANISWQEASEFVEKVYEEDEDDVVLGQSPLLIALALVTFLVGAGMLVSLAYGLYEAYQVSPQNAGDYLKADLRHTLRFLIIGPAIIIGSLKGMEKVWSSILKKIGVF